MASEIVEILILFIYIYIYIYIHIYTNKNKRSFNRIQRTETGLKPPIPQLHDDTHPTDTYGCKGTITMMCITWNGQVASNGCQSNTSLENKFCSCFKLFF